jgi:hypothetical protein
MCVWELADLRADRRDHAAITMPETGHGGATASVEVTIAVSVDHVDAFTAYGARGNLEQTAV